MSGPPPSAYIDASTFSEAEKDAMRFNSSNPAKILGPIVIATLLDHILLGMVVVQSWAYFCYSRDTLKSRALVLALLVVNLAQSTIAFYTLFTMFGVGFGQWEGTTTNLYFESIMMTEALSGALSQVFFLERAFALVRRFQSSAAWILVGFSVPAMLACFALGLASGSVTVIQASGSTNFDNFEILSHLIVSWKSVSVATDALLTGTIVACLIMSRTGLKSTDRLVFKIVRWVVEAQTLPLLASIFFLAAYANDPSAQIFLIASFSEGKLCALSVLYMLNSRGRERSERSSSDPSDSVLPSSLRPQKSRKARGAAAQTISVSTVTHTRYSTYAEDPLPLSLNKNDDDAHLQPPSHRLKYSTTTDEERGEVEEDEKIRRVEDGKNERTWPSTSTSVGRRDLPEIDMIDTGRAPIGEIRVQRIGEEVPAFEDIRW